MKMLLAFVVGLIAAPILFVLAAVAGWLPSSSRSQPPKWESSIGMRSLDTSLERRSDGLTNPIAANDVAALASGGKIYSDNCAGCHGSAKGPSSFGSGFYPRVPQFFQEGADVNPKEAYAAIHDGVRYSGMPAWDKQLTDEQMWQVANFIGAIKAPGGRGTGMNSIDKD